MNPASLPDPAPAPPRILVVDDEEIVVVALSETLRRERYQVVTTLSPVTALDILARESFAVIISDQQMPQFSGLELLAQAKQLQPDAIRILITAVLSLDTVIDAINKGEVYRFVVKPWLREELLVTVKNAVQRHELVRKNAQFQAETQAVNARLVHLNRSLEQQLRLGAQQNQQLAQFNAALQNNLRRGAELGLRMLETFSPTLGAQSRRVQSLCQRMAAALNLGAENRQTLETAASLYDIGLVGVPRDLIQRCQERPDNLSQAERALIEQHPVVGQNLVGFMHHLKEVGSTIRSHHERFDGQGYPDRLAGDAIPWLGRLLAVAAASAAHPREDAEALDHLRRGSGTVFDPEAVRVLLRVVPAFAG